MLTMVIYGVFNVDEVEYTGALDVDPSANVGKVTRL